MVKCQSIWVFFYAIINFIRFAGIFYIMKKNYVKGKAGEELAFEYVLKKGFTIIEKNWRYSRIGEIDIIASDKNTLAFIEVKTRTTDKFGHPAESINQAKMNKIIKLAQIYLSQNEKIKFDEYRFDAVCVILHPRPEVTYLQDIYQF